MHLLVGLIEHLGDIVACEPVSRYLKINNPEAQLTWAVSPAYRELIDSNPYIDETLTLECLTDWIKLTKHDSYDRIVDLHVNYRVCSHCRIPLVKGQGNPFVTAYEWFDYGTLLEAFSVGAGLPALSAQPNLYLKDEHALAVDELDLPSRFCVIHAESNNVEKDWRKEYWRELSEWIKNDLKLDIVEVGAGKISGPSPLADGSISLINRLPILQTAEVIRRAQFFIGVDSGPAHIANAVKTPGVVLLGRHGFFRQYMPFNGLFASNVPQVKMVRNLTGFVSDLSVDEVTEAVRYVAVVTEVRSGTNSFSEAASDDRASPPPPQSPSSFSHAEHREEILKSGLFDPGWYGVEYPDAIESGMDLLDHFLTVGWAERRSPSASFNASRYLQMNEDVARAGVDPLYHYLYNGRREVRAEPVSFKIPDGSAWIDGQDIALKSGLPVRRLLSERSEGGTLPAVPRKPQAQNEHPRTFAFYLPQFYPIPENNWAHGAGFTEWNNIVKTEPLFKNHYQPRIPGELGFYDLRSPDVLRQQIDLARQHGITGFCFYYYYFHGKKLLYTPIKNYIASNSDAPFFFLWANENWSKRWDGGDSEVIIAQRHSKEDDVAFIRELLAVFEDDRYVKIEGKPILLIYKSHLFPAVLDTIDIWREEAKRHGFPGLYLVMVDDWSSDLIHPRQYGFDASYEIPSNVVPQQVLSSDLDTLDLQEGFAGRIVDYPKFANFHSGRPFPEYKRFRTVMLPWDNTPRYGSQAMVHINGQGDAYKVWLMQALLDTYRRYAPDERIVFLHSWNEWCEGTYLEPDGKFGRMFLEQTREAIAIVREAIDLGQDASGATPVIAELLKVMQAKDEGAYRVMQSTRMQTAYIWQELERTRNEVAEFRAKYNSAITVRDALSRSTSWKIGGPLRTIARKFLRR